MKTPDWNAIMQAEDLPRGTTPRLRRQPACREVDATRDASNEKRPELQESHLTEGSLTTVVQAAVRAALEQDNSPWLDVHGCARYLNCGPKLVHARSGPNAHGPDALPVHRLGPNGEKRFHKDDLDAWLKKS